MNLYILGNGFDLIHGLPTHYSDFAKFCIETNLQLFEEMNTCFPNLNINGLWANFESALGHPNEKYLMDGIKKRSDRDYDIGVNTNSLTSAFGDWAYAINQSLNHLQIKRFFDFRRDDIFITINYTNVLEKIYNINLNNILHIHGGGKGTELGIFKGYIYGHNIQMPTAQSDNEQAIKDYIDNLKKDTRENELENFIKRIDSECKIDNIIVIGHSMAKVDHVYLEKLVKRYNDVHWNIHYFNDIDMVYKINSISDLKIKNYRLISDR